MIRITSPDQPRRRLAVISVPRPQKARLGRILAEQWEIRNTQNTAWTTVADATPDTTDNWLSYVLQAQALARETTPGTLSYTPANNTPQVNVAPYNSWLSPNSFACGTAIPGGPPTPDAPQPSAPRTVSPWWLLIGAIGAAASAKYLLTGR